jgi:hypothetical protein
MTSFAQYRMLTAAEDDENCDVQHVRKFRGLGRRRLLETGIMDVNELAAENKRSRRVSHD